VSKPVSVSCGINHGSYPNLVGHTVAAVRNMLAIPLDIAPDAVAFIDGRRVTEDALLKEGDDLNFQRTSSTKGLCDLHQGTGLMQPWGKTLPKAEMSLRELEESIRLVRARWPGAGTNGSSAGGGGTSPESLRQLRSALSDMIRRCEDLPGEADSIIESAWKDLEANELPDWDGAGRQVLEILTREAEAVAQAVKLVHLGETSGILPGSEGKLAGEECSLRERVREFLDSWPWSTGNKPGDEEDAAGARKALEALPSFDELWRSARQYPPPPGWLDEE
jgi:hypothetical protein